jgi:hypothetical protein
MPEYFLYYTTIYFFKININPTLNSLDIDHGVKWYTNKIKETSVNYRLKCTLRRILTGGELLWIRYWTVWFLRGGKYVAISNSSPRTPLLHGIFLLHVKFEVVTTVAMRIRVLWDMMLCSPVRCSGNIMSLFLISKHSMRLVKKLMVYDLAHHFVTISCYKLMAPFARDINKSKHEYRQIRAYISTIYCCMKN